jgi:hypothetical protein
MDDQARVLNTVIQCLSDNGFSVLTLIAGMVSAHNLNAQRLQTAREDLEHDAVDICACLFGHAPSSIPVSTWALWITQSTLHSEVEEMTKKKHSLRFNASTVTAEQIELTFMPQLAGKMHLLAPNLWGLVFTMLGALNERRLSDMVDPLAVDLTELFEAAEQLGDLGGDEEAEEGPVRDDGKPEAQPEDDRRPRKRSCKDMSAHNTALHVIIHYILLRLCKYKLSSDTYVGQLEY